MYICLGERGAHARGRGEGGFGRERQRCLALDSRAPCGLWMLLWGISRNWGILYERIYINIFYYYSIYGYF